jgi:hypothetical protein
MRDYNPIKNIANLCLGQLLQQCLSIYVKLYGHQNFMHTFNAQQTGQIIATWCLQSQPLRARGELTRAQFLTGQPTQLIQLSEAHKRSQTCVLQYTEFKHVQKQTYHGDFFARTSPPPGATFGCFFNEGI